jgi:predicted PurR-regulated permease PerM
MLKRFGSTSFGLMNQNRALGSLAFTLMAVAVLAGLYWAQSVVVPLALGILFTTIAAPVLRYIERWGIGRIPGVVALTVVVVAVAAGLAWLIFAQAAQLAVDLPQYQENILAKVDYLKQATHSRSRESWDRLMKKVQESLKEDEAPAPPSPPVVGEETPAAPAHDPLWLPAVTVVFGLMAQVAGHVALAGVVAIFLLVDREDFRNRIIQLVGRGQITQTTKALDDAARRISRFLLMQALINSSYGVVLAICLTVLGVKYAILWGVLAAVLRYIPYVGGTIATVFPVTLSLAQFPTWWPALVIVGIVITQEIIVNNFVEPKLFGHSIGVSSVALIVAAAFWTFLWGPMGLIMAGPLTVCLVVLGKYVPALRFLDVLLGDQTPLDQEVILYQRLLAKDELETERLLSEELAEKAVAEVYDELVFPAAMNAGADREQGLLSGDDEQYVYDELAEIMANNAPSAASTALETSSPPVKLLLVPARDSGDRLGVAALLQTLHPAKYTITEATGSMMSAEIVAQAEEQQVDGLVISSLPPGGLSHTKYLCKRLRAKLPGLKIFVGHWSASAGESQGWSNVDADVVAHTLADMLNQLDAWKPVLESSAKAETPTLDSVPAPHLGFATAPP